MSKNILFYTYEYPPIGTGVANASKFIFQEFSKRDDYKVDVITSSIENKWEKIKLYDNITMYKVPIGKKTQEKLNKQTPLEMGKFTILSTLLSIKLHLKKKYSVAHFFGYPGGFPTLLFAWRTPYIISLRGVDVPGYNEAFKKYYFLYKPAIKIVWRFAKKVIANSEGLAEMANRVYPNLTIDIIPNGVDTDLFKPIDEKDKLKKFTITAGPTTMTVKKGLEYLIEGFSIFNKKYPDTLLAFIGSGKYEPNLKELVSEKNLNDKIKFLGWKPKEWVPKNLPKFHLLCLPSINEGMANAILEGIACGLPIIVTNTGGTKEMFNNNGIIVRKRNSQDIASALEKIYTDKKFYEECQRNSRERATLLNWERVGSDYLNIYDKISS